MSPALESTDAKNKLEDLSGVKIKPGENPYKALIEACHDDAVRLIAWRRLWKGVHYAIMDEHWLGQGHQARDKRCHLVKTSSAISYTYYPVRVHC